MSGVYHLLHTCHIYIYIYIKVTVNFPASECFLHYFVKIFVCVCVCVCVQIQCLSECLEGRLGKIREDNIKIDAREMEFQGVQRLSGLAVIIIKPTFLEIINCRHSHSPFKRLM